MTEADGRSHVGEPDLLLIALKREHGADNATSTGSSCQGSDGS